MFQLHLFEAMGKKVDKSNSLYKQYNLQIIAKQVQETGKIFVSKLLQSPMFNLIILSTFVDEYKTFLG